MDGSQPVSRIVEKIEFLLVVIAKKNTEELKNFLSQANVRSVTNALGTLCFFFQNYGTNDCTADFE